MKKLFVILVVLFTAFVIGCNDNHVTDPLSSNVPSTLKTPDNSYIHGVIPVKCNLKDPNSLFSECRLSGRIAYELRIVYVDAPPPSPQSYISLKLTFKGKLNQFDSFATPWTISSWSNDFIPVTQDGIHTLIKYSAIQGRDDGTVLVCRYFVTTKGVDLDCTWLSPADVDINAMDSAL